MTAYPSNALNTDSGGVYTAADYGDRGDGTNAWVQAVRIRDVAAAGILKAEDAAHASGDAGVMALAVRANTPAATAADGDYVPLLVNTNGKLWVAGSHNEDAAHATGDTGVQMLSVRKATPAVQTDADGDYASILTDANGAVWTRPLPRAQTIQVTAAGLTNSAYTSGDVMGTEMTFAGAARDTGGGGIIRGAILIDKVPGIATVAAIDLFLFDSASTPAADNAPADWSDTNIAKLVAIVPFALADVKTFSSNSVVAVSGLTIPYLCAATSLFGVLVTRGAPAGFAAATNIVVTLKVERD